MVGVYLTTTGTLSPVVIDDMGALSFAHPTAGYNLLDDVTEDEIQSSTDLQALVTAGHVTLKDDSGDPITDVQAAGPHHHPIGDVDGLQTALDAKASAPTADTVTTADAALTTLSAIAIPDDTVVLLTVKVVGRRTNAADRAAYVRRFGVFRESAGSATLIGSVQTIFSRESDSSWACNVAVSGNDALVRVQGAVGHDVNWKCTYLDGTEVN